MSTNGRLIGLRHRRKMTTDGEARPTQLAIREPNGTMRTLELSDATEELDFVLGTFPISWRRVEEGEDISRVLPRHVRTRKAKGEDEPVVSIPSAFEGFREGDTLLMVLGGSGDRFAYAASRRGEEIGASVFRVPPFVLAERRGEKEKDGDASLLIRIFDEEREVFYRLESRDRDLIRVVEHFRDRRDVQKDRIRCTLRLYQRMEGQVFLSPVGRYPEGTIEDAFDAVKANDAVLGSLIAEEGKATRALAKAVQAISIWKELFDPIEGCGETLAAAIISAVQDIRRFPTKAQFKAYCGVHLVSGHLSCRDCGNIFSQEKAIQEDEPTPYCPKCSSVEVEPHALFARKRKGQVSNWNPTARQAFVLLSDQWNKRPDSEWGLKLRQWKRIFRERHPEVVVVDGKRRYTNGHIHKMGLWRTQTKFAEFLFRRWWQLERASSSQ